MKKEIKKVPTIRFKGFTDDWEQRKLREVFSSLQNNTFSREDLNDKNGIAQNIHYGDVLIKYDECLDVSKENLDYIDKTSAINKFQKSFLKNGDVVVADTAEDETVGKCTEIQGVSKEKIISGLHTIPLRPVQKFGIGYLGFYMNSNSYHDQLKPLMQGIKVTSISKSAMADTIMKYPINLKEQQKIGACLQFINTLITLHQRKLKQLQALKKYFLQNMFLAKKEKVPAIRFKGFTDDWEQRKLSDIADVRDGTHDSPQYVDEGYPFITSKNVSNGYITYDDIHYISEKDFNEINKRSKVNAHDILMGMIGTIGNLALIREKTNFAIKNVALIKYTGCVNYNFLYQALQSPLVVNQLSGTLDGGTQKFISLGKIRKLSIPYSSEEEANKIGAYLENLDNLITLHHRKCDQLQSLKKFMLQNLFI